MKTDLMNWIAASSIILTLFFIPANVAAQEKVTSALIKQDTMESYRVVNDSLGIQAGKIRLSPELHAKSGSLAMLFSALLPCSGQIYAHRYWTIPLFLGFGGYFTSVAITANQQYQDYRGKYSESIRLDSVKHLGDSYTLSVRDFYRDQRDQFLFYLAITYFLNIVDAYVGAVLYDFDISDELGGRAAIQVRVPLR